MIFKFNFTLLHVRICITHFTFLFILRCSPKGNKLEMFAGVKNQMSGWLSGGIPGLSRGAGAGEGEAQPPPAESEETQLPQESQAPAGEQVKDDDASRWVWDRVT